ncbi:superoxide dismutase [Flavobacterium sp. 123]|jgi:Fe-Mn family superoxide dismutase|uniref:superoxide dismutase n=1 Tax=Flavobacterium sp. 123 TaxID=2135627 RepID=UPI000EB353A8|nr:superoxide dismutase [Flavobacterium sp. 123]RKS98471.1 Fe-Mn family superoxide dismutase [Flavobacterium sp. 123]
MKRIVFLLLFTSLLSCNKKKYTEVVEVPLPTAQEKVSVGIPDDVKADDGSFLLDKLPYNYDALSPNISALTLEMHYSKHYLAYTNNLNKAIAGTPLENLTIEEVLHQLDINDPNVRNNAGGFYNHSLYWKCMAPKNGGQPTDSLAEAITRDFGSFEDFKTLFKEEATKQFGSGWTWLIVDRSGKLQVTNTQNQDNPLMRNALMPGTPILALDDWEHAYYLDYQYKRKNYIDAFFTIINWKQVGENYDAAIKTK